jgi:hypothetical protein
MDLIGRKAGFYLSPLGSECFFGAEARRRTDAQFFVGGRVVADSPTVGPWVEIECIADRPDNPIILPDPRSTFLIRWEWVTAATLLPKDSTERPIPTPPIGFSPSREGRP